MNPNFNLFTGSAKVHLGGGRGIRTPVGLHPNGFQDRLVVTASIFLRTNQQNYSKKPLLCQAYDSSILFKKQYDSYTLVKNVLFLFRNKKPIGESLYMQKNYEILNCFSHAQVKSRQSKDVFKSTRKTPTGLMIIKRYNRPPRSIRNKQSAFAVTSTIVLFLCRTTSNECSLSYSRKLKLSRQKFSTISSETKTSPFSCILLP